MDSDATVAHPRRPASRARPARRPTRTACAHRTIEVELEANETFVVLTGTGQLSVDGGAPIDLTPGVRVSVPSGAHTSWVVDHKFSEIWVYG